MKKLGQYIEKKRWEVKIKLSQYNPRKPDLATTEVSTLKSKFIFYTCDERGHFARDCPKNKSSSHKKKRNKRRHHAHATEDDEPSTKRNIQVSDDSSSDKEYVLISTLTGTITHGSNDWLIDSGASKI